ncbi:MAG: hypothetical protein AB8H79_25280 [Myxococcota bacterium]
MDLPAPGPIPLPMLIDRPAPMIEAFSANPPDRQVNWVRSLGVWQLRRLWRLSVDYPQPLSIDEFAAADGSVTRCRGKNHLPIFSWFEKRFARIGDEIVGYNETGWEKTFVGPGHFILRSSEDDPHEVIVDYRTPPVSSHPEFPDLKASGFLAGLVYGGLVDRVRRVGDRLLIGRSAASGFSLQSGAFFALHLPSAGASEDPQV